MLGSIMDALTAGPKNMMMEEDRNQRQQDAWGMAQYNQDYNSAMAATAHQREVADLRKAGLNPMLSVNRGAPSPVSSGSGGTGGTSQDIPAHFNLGELMEVNKDNTVADTAKKWAERSTISQQFNQSQAQTALINEQYRTQQELTNSARAQSHILAEDEKGRKLEGEIDETQFGRVMRYIDRAMNAIRGGSSAIQQQRNPVREHRRLR